MNSTISIITPVLASGAKYLAEAYTSILAQQLPDGWEWEWIVQEDDETGSVATLIPQDDQRISFGQGRHGGPGVARTLALERATGSLIKELDVDDQLLPGALARDIEILTSHPDIGWTTSKALDLLPDGSTVCWDQDDPPGGRLSGEFLFQFWLDHDYRLPVLPATICIKRELLLAVGGWMALPASEDSGMLLAASVIRDGYFIPDSGLLYRKWPGQATAQAAHLDPVERNARMEIIKARVMAMRSVPPFSPRPA
ncbi:glycosyl transferase [Planosporangium mesophilum]|uniref:Glycosyl transferase n=1 Tax=Planosporangium mesophilum TaxID=689768 RepID=A0A8J3X1E1_9ACTN|nr:glycosyltransferase [Planosporangium mesophilum]NJC81490.1 glycosyltransferase [Planosporangium mesophilum]GII20853.1 glycosyl transferase [Planosporangium mesophilum]